MPVKLVLCVLLAHALVFAQDVKRIYIDGIGQKSSLDKAKLEKAKKDLVAQLRKVKNVEVVDSPSQANVILSGDGEIYIKGFYSLNPRSGISPANGQPVYGGYLSVELKDTSGAILWSYLANAPETKDAAHDLSKDIVRHLAAQLLGKS